MEALYDKHRNREDAALGLAAFRRAPVGVGGEDVSSAASFSPTQCEAMC